MAKWGKKAVRLTAGILAVSMVSSPCVTFAAPGDANAYLETSDEDNTTDFEMLRSKWKTLLTGAMDGDRSGKAQELFETYAKSIDELSVGIWNSMIKLGEAETDTRSCLFSDLPMSDKVSRTGSSQITLTFDRLKAVALAYETEGAQLYGNPEVKKELIAALDMMVKDHYSVYYACGGVGPYISGGTKAFGNWYDWRIGSPRQLCDMLLMFYDELTPEQIKNYTAPIIANNKQVDTTGANKTWIANIFIQCGILRSDGDLITAGKNGLKDVFKYVDTGDGFHKDGSFIQHNVYAYTGGYGKALLCTLAPLMHVLNDTEYEITYDDDSQQMFYDMLFEAYEPLIYGGRFMDMAREREISRVANQDSVPGRQAIRSMIMLLDVLPEDQRTQGWSMVKEWLSDETVLDQVCVDEIGGYNEYYLPAGVIDAAAEIADSDTEPRGPLIKHKRYGAMDRVVHLRD